MPKRKLRPFPPGFLFGAGTADHQCEAYDERWPDLYDRWEATHHLQLRGQASDFWNRFQEDIALAKSLGCNAFRFSVAWSRVEPQPGVFDQDNLRHYRSLVEAMLAVGIQPVLTLLHNTWPLHVEATGGLLAPDFADRFARYARTVAESVGDGVEYWVTINEPTQLTYGFVKPWWWANYPIPPGMPPGATGEQQMDAVQRVITSLFRAHTQGRAAIRAVHPAARVGTNPLLLGLPVWLQRFVDDRTMRLKEHKFIEHGKTFTQRPPLHGIFEPFLRAAGILTTAINGNWWHLGMAGKLPTFLCPEECIGQQDFVGLDYYWGIPRLRLDKVEHLLEAAQQHYARAPVWPRVLYDTLRYYGRLFPHQEILIIENGCVTTADGVSRARYVQDHLHEVQRAISHGVNVIGYLGWSITSNREWGLPFDGNSDFGLFHIELDDDPSLTRTPTESSRAYQQIIAERGVRKSRQFGREP